MNPVQWAVLQITSYHPNAWCFFIIVAGVASYYRRFRGILVGHIVIAAVVFWLDNQWIESAMSAPGWDGSPDRDLIFAFGVVIRVLLINSLLLPVSVATMLFASRKRIAEIFFSPLPAIPSQKTI